MRENTFIQWNTVTVCGMALVALLLPSLTKQTSYYDDFRYKCVPFQEAFMCSEAPYNSTFLPNAFGHQNLGDVQSALNDFIPLMVKNCSESLKEFLCFVFAPPCTVLEKPIPVCRSFCEEAATTACMDILREYNQKPQVLQCANYPRSGLCIDQNNTISPNGDSEEGETTVRTYYPEKEIYFTDKNNLGSREESVAVDLFLLVTSQNKIQLLDIRSPNSMDTITLYRGLSEVIGTSVDYYIRSQDERYIYWASNTDGAIMRAELHYDSLRNIRSILDLKSATVDSVAVDWRLGVLFWLESFPLAQLRTASLSGRGATTLLQNMQHPLSLTMDPIEGRLFWIERRGSILSQTSTLESYSLQSDRKFHVYNMTATLPAGGRPRALVADVEEKKLYWADARSQSLHVINYDGTGHVQLLSDHEHLGDPGSLAVHGDHVLWTDVNSNSIVWVNKVSGRDELVVKTFDVSPPQNVKVYGARDKHTKTSYDISKLDKKWKDLTSKESRELYEYDDTYYDDDDEDYFTNRRRKKKPQPKSSAASLKCGHLCIVTLLMFFLIVDIVPL
ncbi:low-density lipoprotein receptor 1-like [Mya arenaria]|uniref:low-density lipoprotein receptor 1-like n=1 Tax=Mya arenaria TaxID=6604 RepID=UPI0022E6EA36|nr:low-density lipoprotein receptor 1-like [Mya arenaria]